MSREKICGVYYIKNLINGKKYVGKSNDIKSRWSVHIRSLNNNKHYSLYLQRAWNKYGQENFEFKIVEKCSVDIVNDREKYWIDKFDTFKNGYNLSLGGEGTFGYKHTNESKRKMSIQLKGKKQSKEIIQKRLVGLKNTMENGYKPKTEHLQIYNNAIKKKIRCYNSNCELVGEFESIHEAEKQLNIEASKICSVLNNRTHTVLFDDYTLFTFFYADSNFSYDDILKQFLYFNAKLKRKVFKIDRQGNVLESYNSLIDCYESQKSLSRNVITELCANRKKSSKDFSYIYENIYNTKNIAAYFNPKKK